MEKKKREKERKREKKKKREKREERLQHFKFPVPELMAPIAAITPSVDTVPPKLESVERPYKTCVPK